jgi:hypothetical protein
MEFPHVEDCSVTLFYFSELQTILYIFITTDVGFVGMQLNMKQLNDA